MIVCCTYLCDHSAFFQATTKYLRTVHNMNLCVQCACVYSCVLLYIDHAQLRTPLVASGCFYRHRRSEIEAEAINWAK